MGEPVILGLAAMRTRFELVLIGGEPESLKAAGYEALDEIRAVEQQLSIFEKDSALNRLNADAGAGPVKVAESLWQVLQLCRRVFEASDGAFDPSVGPLLDESGARDQAPLWATPSSARVGFDQIEFDADARRIHFADPDLRLDLGAVGKGWALDRAAEVLRDAEVPAALLHGGQSTVLSYGAAQPELGWPIGIEPHACVALRDAALSVSETRPATRNHQPHIIDPRDPQPLRSQRTAAVVAASAAEADAWSTARLVRSTCPFSWLNLL